MRNIVAVISARAGSKRIRRKNMRLLRGRPLIEYALRNALSSEFIDTVVVSSDDDQILEYSSKFRPVLLRKRPVGLAGDEVTLDPVVYDAVNFAEEKMGKRFTIVVTLQPTCPTLSPKNLDAAIKILLQSSYDSLLAVVDDTALKWKVENGLAVPLYEKRLNSQWLPKEYKETGAFLITRREFLTVNSRLGKRIGVYLLPVEEAVDIDEPLDWLIAETLLSRLKIAFVLIAGQTVGMGHLYRCLTLADAFFGHSLHLYGVACSAEAMELAADYGYYVNNCSDLDSVYQELSSLRPNIVINDILDTPKSYIEKLLNIGFFVINFEDLGPGSKLAHLVFNALYELSTPPNNHKFGPDYVCLREEFLLTDPAPFRKPAKILLITFGGVDEHNLTCKVLKALPDISTATQLEKVLVVLGPGYSHVKELEQLLATFPPKLKELVEIHSKVSNMAKLLKRADVAVTSNGRTVYELAAMRVPAVIIAQNDRETLHLFSRYSQGFRYLGQAPHVSTQAIAEAITEIFLNGDLRGNMRAALLDIDIRSGLKRVRKEILNAYWG